MNSPLTMGTFSKDCRDEDIFHNACSVCHLTTRVMALVDMRAAWSDAGAHGVESDVAHALRTGPFAVALDVAVEASGMTSAGRPRGCANVGYDCPGRHRPAPARRQPARAG
ncbi:hypothetical protein [Catellatospora vulcania]|uniref:hypothetical protein n=1 Tax=Catellatospora vulcania TaxID=1460450 RepID=UPI0012D38061|nr:hypothetical protein [Catellatospora vulcania]